MTACASDHAAVPHTDLQNNSAWLLSLSVPIFLPCPQLPADSGAMCVWGVDVKDAIRMQTWLQLTSQERNPLPTGPPPGQLPHVVRAFSNDPVIDKYVNLADLKDAQCSVLLVGAAAGSGSWWGALCFVGWSLRLAPCNW